MIYYVILKKLSNIVYDLPKTPCIRVYNMHTKVGEDSRAGTQHISSKILNHKQTNHWMNFGMMQIKVYVWLSVLCVIFWSKDFFLRKTDHILKSTDRYDREPFF